ncbi:hypothetical protein PORY_002812 [Pneumocystis oryctolagi]|uniref:Uncharacterized protein n=1 Tax=Pneumocystis oryctolagi TaxID=42067 RepID=A0ACB7C9S0_9ASCO|nr:hypothetical protein PORY_002812 [Pneumocystis oryctolagi]
MLHLKQYTELENLYQKYKDSGFVVLAFPCNQFGHQEPWSNDEIARFCSDKYHVTFPVMDKIDVNGINSHPLYTFLKTQKAGILGFSRIKWNFEKFLVDKNGVVVALYFLIFLYNTNMFEETEELVEARNLLYEGCYSRLLNETVNDDEDSFVDDASAASKLTLRVLRGRAMCLSGGASELLWKLRDATSPVFVALRGWARTLEGDIDGVNEICTYLDELDSLDFSSSALIRILAATSLFYVGQIDQARSILHGFKHVEVVALSVQMWLSDFHLETAQREIEAAKAWAKDDLVIRLAEAWVDMYRGGRNLLNAFYIYEDLAQTVTSSMVLTGQAVTELLLGRTEDASETLKQALSLSPHDGDLLANSVVAAILLGNDFSDYVELLTLHHPSHPWVVSTAQQSALFDQFSKTFLLEMSDASLGVHMQRIPSFFACVCGTCVGMELSVQSAADPIMSSVAVSDSCCTDFHKNAQNVFIFSDFDGTVIMQDTGHLLFDQYGCGPERRIALEALIARGECSFRDVSSELWGKLRLSLAQSISWVLPNLEIDSGFLSFFEFCTHNHIPFRIVSSGLRPLLLAALSKFVGRETAEQIEIISNDVKVTSDGVWEPIWHDETPLGHDKAASIRKCMAMNKLSCGFESDNPSKCSQAPRVVFIGDGVSDFSVVKDVDILFARKGLSLEKYCLERGIPYIPYETFADVQREISWIIPIHEEDSGFQYVRTKRSELEKKTDARNIKADESVSMLSCARKLPAVQSEIRSEWSSHVPCEDGLPHFSSHITDSFVELPISDTPVIEKNRDLRQRRRSSLGFRGKRASSILANALPHPSISHESFFKHISEDLPDAVRMKQLLIWCAKRALEDQKVIGTCKNAHAISLARVIEEEILNDLIENRLSASWYNREDDNVLVKPKPHPRNVENRKKIKEFEKRLSKLKQEINNWNELEASFLSNFSEKDIDHTKSLTDNINASYDMKDISAGETLDKMIEDALLPSEKIKWVSPVNHSELIKWLNSEEENLEFKVDRLYHSLHLINSFGQVSNQYATQLLNNVAKAIEKRKQQAQMDSGSNFTNTKDVLRAITRCNE